MKIGFISCSSKKLNKKCCAKELYSPSTLFFYALKYCLINYDKTYILSAKYGLVELEDILEPYNLTLNKMNKEEINNWAQRTSFQIKEKLLISDCDELYFHCGERYCSVIKYLNIYKIYHPLEGLIIGKQLNFYKENIIKKLSTLKLDL